MNKKMIHIEALINDPESTFIRLDTKLRPIFHALLMKNYNIVENSIREDLIQDCFIKLYSNKEKLIKHSSDINIESYLIAMLKNLAIDHLRNESKKNSFNEIAELINEDVYTENIEIFKKSFLVLNTKEQKIIGLVALGYTSQEISANLKISPLSVRSDISLIRKKLIKEVNKLKGEKNEG